jgi:hypothetical protein
MKKTIISINFIIAVAAFTAFTACSKEMTHPVSNTNSSYSTGSASHLGNTVAATKGSHGYTGGTGTGDSTKVTTQP